MEWGEREIKVRAAAISSRSHSLSKRRTSKTEPPDVAECYGAHEQRVTPSEKSCHKSCRWLRVERERAMACNAVSLSSAPAVTRTTALILILIPLRQDWPLCPYHFPLCPPQKRLPSECGRSIIIRNPHDDCIALIVVDRTDNTRMSTHENRPC